jgi:hypothetical protein
MSTTSIDLPEELPKYLSSLPWFSTCTKGASEYTAQRATFDWDALVPKNEWSHSSSGDKLD